MKNNQEPFGTLTNGAQIVGEIDRVHPDRRTGIVEATFDGWRMMAQDSPDLLFIDMDGIQLAEVTIAQVNALRSLLATDMPEQLIAAAVAYGRGDAADTYAEAAQNPEMQAAFAALSPEAQGITSRLVKLLDSYPPDAAERAIDYVLDSLTAPPSVDDQPICTVIDDGERSGVRLERYDAFDGSGAWLDFRIGEGRPCRALASVALDGSRQGLHLIIAGHSINVDTDDIWTLADLRRLHSDLGRLLADERLLGALAEQTS